MRIHSRRTECTVEATTRRARLMTAGAADRMLKLLRQPKILCGLLSVLLLHAQGPAPSRPLTPGEQPDVQTLSRTVQALRRGATPAAATAAQADQLIEDAAGLLADGQSGEARRKLAHAQSLITG